MTRGGANPIKFPTPKHLTAGLRETGEVPGITDFNTALPGFCIFSRILRQDGPGTARGEETTENQTQTRVTRDSVTAKGTNNLKASHEK